MKRRHSLKTFVHRTLVIRLFLGGLSVSLIIGIVAFFHMRSTVSDLILDHAVRATTLFNEQNMQLFDGSLIENQEIVQKRMLSFRANQVQSMIGRYVFAGLYTKDGDMVGEMIDESYAGIAGVKAFVMSSEKKVPENREKIVHRIKRLAGIPYLFTVVPVVNSKDDIVGLFAGMFAPSDETVLSVRLRGVKTMLGAMLIVLLTTALLYPVIISLTNKLSDFSVKLLDANLETLETLGSAIAKRDSDTNAHNYRVTIISVRLAEEVGLPRRDIQTLIKGAFLHDVGKIGIRDSILLKPGHLSDDEFQEMKEHVSHGHEIVKRSEWLKDALEVVSNHHEKMSGKGYLHELTGDEIPVTARIFAIADVFDALTSERPYKEPYSFNDSMAMLEEGRGSDFDPELLDAFSYIAKPLYESLSGREDELQQELQNIIHKYFTEGIESLDY
ncbi:MAG: HD-GYP domain-containing protein [Nitrospiraceae bacterium]|nr:MAG: HD-GYP domain-containing protein [Nitrospiraceae bacterium]